MELLWLALPGLVIWASILLLPWRPWSTQEALEADSSCSPDLSQVTVLIPARNEQDVIAQTLVALTQQGQGHKIILIDDQSSDNTVAVASKLDLDNLSSIKGLPLASGWSGKLWALEQARHHADTDYLLLLDADIELKPGTLAALLAKIKTDQRQLVSLMAFLRMENFWERLLMPAFIYFFKLLYPFRLSNSGSTLVAAAAGGCILISKQALDGIGGFSAIRDALIDDCCLARKVKQAGNRTWIGLSHSAVSLRQYPTLQTIWQMVARTAFTQLQYSTLLLGLCTLLLIAAFILPLAALFSQEPVTIVLALISLALMLASYLPTLKFYDVNIFWGLTLPIAGVLYLLMTWCSATHHWRGRGSIWKDRTYTRQTD